MVADRVAGGVVAFQLAMNFFFLPVALGATPVALSLVPRLSRMTGPGQERLFRDTYVQGLVFAAFLVIPAATAYAVLAGPLASAIGFGGFGTGSAVHLITASLIGLAPGIIGQTFFLVTTFACYARGDAIHPAPRHGDPGGHLHRRRRRRLPAARSGAADRTRPRPVGGRDRAGSLYLVRHLLRGLPSGGESALRPLLRTVNGSIIMIGPAWATAAFLDGRLNSRAGHAIAMITASW